MIIVLKPHSTEETITRVENMVKNRGLDTHIVRGTEMTIIVCMGYTTLIDPRLFEVDSSVDKVMHVQEPYKLANRAFHPEDSVIDVSGVKIGGGHMGLIAGPCSVESFDQVLEIAKAAKAAGKEAHGTICYTKSPVHTIDSFVKLGCELQDLGCDAVVIKDMAGLIPPHIAFDIVKGLKKNIKLPVIIHTHETAGMGAPTYYAAVDAGVDAIDTSIAPFANGTGQPDTARMLAMLEGHERKPDYDMKKLAQLREIFQKIYKELAFYTMAKNEVIDTDALIYQVPGGMLSNFRNQLKEQKMEDKFEEVFAEVPYVREKLGWIPLVPPTSQIVGPQAMMNVKFGRWKMFTPQAMDIALGYYGRTPAPVDPEIRKLAQEKSGKEPIECRPADLKKPGMEDLRKALRAKGLKDDDEHCVIYAMFPQQLEDLYTKPRSAFALKKPSEKVQPAKSGSSNMKITIDGVQRNVSVETV